MKARRLKVWKDISRLHYRVEEVEDGFFNLDDLDILGIRAVKPLWKRIIQRHPPIIPRDEADDVLPPLDQGEEGYRRDPNSESEYDEELDIVVDHITRSLLIVNHLHSLFDHSIRKGFIEGQSLEDYFAPLKSRGQVPTTRGKWRRDLWLHDEGATCTTWRIRLLLEDKEHKMPHAIFDMTSDIWGGDKRLAASEVKAIMRIMRIRTELQEYRSHLEMPLLVLSYMGSKHGRIIQAHHDGKEMIIQCSELFSFKDKETPPVELFLRYYCSEPI